MTEVYVIADGAGLVKVGISGNVRRRLADLQRTHGRKLRLSRSAAFHGGDVLQVERYTHWLLREHHANGEWFSVDEEKALAALLAAGVAVIKGLRAPRPGFGGKGRKKLWAENINLTLPEGAKAEMDAVLAEGEDRLDLIREGIRREVQRRKRAVTKPTRPD